MTLHDSDFSSDEEEGYSSTNVLLGYASKEPTEDTISQLGGHPRWLDSNTAPCGALAKCKVCNDLMTLLLQLNGDMPEHFPGHERRLYVFNCRRRTCRRKEGSVRALRGVRITKVDERETRTQKVKQNLEEQRVQEKPAQQCGIGESLFATKPASSNMTSANPFSTSSTSSTDINPFSTSKNASPFTLNNTTSPLSSLAAKPAQRPDTVSLSATFAEKARISSPSSSTPTEEPSAPPEPWPQEDAFPPPYPPYYLDADYETLDASPNEIPVPTQTMETDDNSTTAGGGGAREDKDAFESSIDKAFQNFADRLAQNPLQILRYEFRSQPLLYSKTDAVGKLLSPHQGHHVADAKVSMSRQGRSGMPRCSNCGGERVFELQLTPQAIAELEVEEVGLEGMEWGTIIVGVCGKDCGGKGVSDGRAGYVEEWVGVQWEEVGGKR
ncbi:MAG: hypothetical protein M1827_000142 [Pycnora praestabilis]|nr:MAG: hypothetical protein M1827_000142 [Pycnora praestabilis]